MRGRASLATSIALLAIATAPAFGANPEGAEVRASLRAEIEALKSRLAALEARLEASESVTTAAPVTAATPIEPAQPSTTALAPVAPNARPDTEIEIYGYAQIDAIQDFGRMHPGWEDSLRPTRIPTVDGRYGGDGKYIASVRQSRLGIQATRPIGNRDLHVKLEADLYGVGADEGKTTLHLRHAYGQYGQWLAGQTNSLFMDGDVFPNTIDYWGPNGMAYLRTAQIRWTPLSGPNSFSVAIEDTGDDIDTGRFGREFPAFGAAAEGHDDWPDLTAQFRMDRDWGHFQAAGILRKVGFDTAGTVDNAPKGDDIGWGLNLSTNLRFGGKDRLILSVLGGKGIASYMNDGGNDLIPDDSAPGRIPDAVAMPLWAAVLYYDHWWNNRWSSSAGYSFTQVDNSNNQNADAFKKGEYASVNLLHYPTDSLLVGAEFLWGRRTDNGGASGTDSRLQVSVKYDFSSKD
ncbi:DcaP family trimeric outer membrane transporter [Luteimonas sp. C3_2_a3]